MTEAAKEAQKAYAREYKRRNRERLNEYQRKWRKNNPDKVKAATARYWEKKAQESE